VLTIFTNIFRNLQKATTLREVNLGLKRIFYGAILGLRQAINDIGVMDEGGFVYTVLPGVTLTRSPS
jgi:hypothetical protein